MRANLEEPGDKERSKPPSVTTEWDLMSHLRYQVAKVCETEIVDKLIL